MEAGNELVVASTNALHSGRVHVVGLGGSGVRGIVPLLLARGATVSGSDMDDSPVLAKFRRDGVECWVGHSDRNVDPKTDLMLISAAVGRDNPEVRAAEQRSIRVVKYSQCLGLLMSEKQGIAVSGTHGKTTTTAMVSYVLAQNGMDPSYIVGGEHPSLGGGSRSGKGNHFVAEACEFDRSFLNLRPKAIAVTNVDEDHLDYFSSMQEIQDAFREFVELLPADGCLVYNKDDPNSQFLPISTAARSQSFSLRPGKGDWWVEDVTWTGGGSRFTLVGPGLRTRVRLRVPGIHNVKNALACVALCRWAGVPLAGIVKALASFQAVRRRFDILLNDPVTVVDDYAHHPTEVEAVLKAARQAYPNKRIVSVFQPHQYSRLRRMLEGFADALTLADDVIVTRVFRARDTEEDVRAVSASELAEAVRLRGKNCLYADSFSRALGQLEGMVESGAVVLFLGAGDITKLGQEYADVLTGSASARLREGTYAAKEPGKKVHVDPIDRLRTAPFGRQAVGS
ncbi:MAG: UDP-N-acetylmuramate--L-alanine ligase [Planctomycetota bacterium]